MSDKNHSHHHPQHEHHYEPVEKPDNLQGGPLKKWMVITGVALVVVAFLWGMKLGFGW